MGKQAHDRSFELVVHFRSDWHIGQGAGQAGNIDKLVRRDPDDGLPYLPAKSITGIWRDSCEAVALGLDEGHRGAWYDLVDAVFGDEAAREAPMNGDSKTYGQPLRQGRLSVRAGRLPESLRRCLQTEGAAQLRRALTITKPGVRIDENTGCALDDHLRFVELVRGNSVLMASWDINIDDLSESEVRCVQAILWAGATTVESMGGNRRRGAGKCEFRVSILDDRKDEWIELLQSENPPRLSPRAEQKVFHYGKPESVEHEEHVTVPINIQLETPVVVPQQTIGNVVTSLDYIPGTYLLGPVMNALQQATDKELFADVACAKIQVSNAYLVVNGKRGRPIPLAFFCDKTAGADNKRQMWNRLVEAEPSTKQLKQQRSGYIGELETGEALKWDRPRRFTLSHATVEDLSQRPTSDVGGVYTYEAIPAGTQLRTHLRLRKSVSDLLGDGWQQHLPSVVRLGVAKKDDYGLASIAMVDESTTSDESTGQDNRSLIDDHGQFSLWFVSDALLRNSALRPATGLNDLEGCLSTLLSTKDDEVIVKARSNDERLSVVLRTRRTEGWNQRWSLPRPSYIAILAGACAVFEVVGWAARSTEKKDTLCDALKKLDCNGLGERRAEGFGEVAISDPMLDVKDAELSSIGKSNSHVRNGVASPIGPDDPARNFAEQIEETAWRDVITRGALSLGSNPRWRSDALKWTREKPPNSQLGTLRTALPQLATPHGRERVVNWLSRTSATRAQKWPDGALDVIRLIVQENARIWEWLSNAQNDDDFRRITTRDVETLQDKLWAEAVQALLFAAISGTIRDRESEQ